MTARIPSDLEQSEILWFGLRCSCGFDTTTAGVGLAGIGETATEHISYRVAWFDDQINVLRYDDFRIPITTQGHQLGDWLQTDIVPRITEVYGNCFYVVPDLPSKTSIQCPMCNIGRLMQYETGDPELDFTVYQH